MDTTTTLPVIRASTREDPARPERAEASPARDLLVLGEATELKPVRAPGGATGPTTLPIVPPITITTGGATFITSQAIFSDSSLTTRSTSASLTARWTPSVPMASLATFLASSSATRLTISSRTALAALSVARLSLATLAASSLTTRSTI